MKRWMVSLLLTCMAGAHAARCLATNVERPGTLPNPFICYLPERFMKWLFKGSFANPLLTCRGFGERESESSGAKRALVGGGADGTGRGLSLREKWRECRTS